MAHLEAFNVKRLALARHYFHCRDKSDSRLSVIVTDILRLRRCSHRDASPSVVRCGPAQISGNSERLLIRGRRDAPRTRAGHRHA
jgi:hypothetical protein